MKKVILLVMLVAFIYAQEAVTKVKISRKAESILATLFEELPQRIDVFVASDSTYIIEAQYRDQKLVRRLMPSEYRDIMQKPMPRIITLENARVPYLVGQTSLGLFLYSWAVPVGLGLEDKGAAVVGLCTPLLYASIHYGLTGGHRTSGGSAYGAFIGGIEGAVHGGLLFNDVRGVLPISLSENILDHLLGQNIGLTPAMFQRKFNHCCYGYYHYAALKTLVIDWDEWDGSSDVIQIGTAVSLVEGYASLLLSRNSENLTYGDVLFEFRTAVMGAEVIPLILATYDLHREEQSDERIYATTSLIGHVFGYVLGRRLTSRYDLSGATSTLMWLLPYLAHGATGGIVVLTESEGLAKSYPAVFLAMDLGLTYLCYKEFAEKAISVGKADVPDFNMAINPLCFVLKDNGVRDIPFVAISYRF